MLTAAALTLLLMLLTFRVIQLRFATKILLGDGGDPLLAAAIRGHGNLTEYAPMALILIGLLEFAGAAMTPLAWLAGIFVAARVAHASGFLRRADVPELLRAVGTIATNGCLIIAAGWAVALAL